MRFSFEFQRSQSGTRPHSSTEQPYTPHLHQVRWRIASIIRVREAGIRSALTVFVSSRAIEIPRLFLTKHIERIFEQEGRWFSSQVTIFFSFFFPFFNRNRSTFPLNFFPLKRETCKYSDNARWFTFGKILTDLLRGASVTDLRNYPATASIETRRGLGSLESPRLSDSHKINIYQPMNHAASMQNVVLFSRKMWTIREKMRRLEGSFVESDHPSSISHWYSLNVLSSIRKYRFIATRGTRSRSRVWFIRFFDVLKAA